MNALLEEIEILKEWYEDYMKFATDQRNNLVQRKMWANAAALTDEKIVRLERQIEDCSQR